MKKTRQRDRDAQVPQTPWDEIVPGLWMGGHPLHEHPLGVGFLR